jgi:hypothetical protein
MRGQLLRWEVQWDGKPGGRRAWELVGPHRCTLSPALTTHQGQTEACGAGSTLRGAGRWWPGAGGVPPLLSSDLWPVGLLSVPRRPPPRSHVRRLRANVETARRDP